MRKVIVSEFMTLDGIVGEPQEWSLAYWNDTISDFKQEELFSGDVSLLGRVTYEGFASAWPDREDDTGFADRINSMPKYVVSTTLKSADWQNSHIISEDVADRIKALKQEDGQDILVAGSITLVRWLTANNLVDEFRFLVYPEVYGKGKRLFDADTQAKLSLIEARDMGSGVVLMRYEPASD